MMQILTTLTLSLITLISCSQGAAPPCSTLLEDASTPKNWSGTINIPLNKQFNKYIDRWELRIRFGSPVNTFNADNVSLTTESKAQLKDTPTSATTILKDITSHKLDNRTFIVSQNKTIDPSVFNNANQVTMNLNFNVIYPGGRLLVTSVNFNDFVMCVN